MENDTLSTLIVNKLSHDLEQRIKIEVNWSQRPIEDNSNEKPEEETNIPSKVTIEFSTKHQGKLILHWAVFRGINFCSWTHPPQDSFPLNTRMFDNNALQTEFTSKEGEDTKTIQIILTQLKEESPKSQINGMNYVFYSPEGNRWYNNSNQNYQIRFNKKKPLSLLKNGLSIPDFVQEIIECETSHGAWTLMHRYHKCHDVIKSFDPNSSNDNLLWVFIWLRFSYQRQLDWQRNFNTRPVELSHATGRLSGEVASQYARAFHKEQPYNDILQSKAALIKNILSLLGKGTGNGQQIRDEILHIMHRNKIKLSGDMFYEQWHQKLHNNTTPDDIIICQAIINFLRSGKIEDYRNTLNEGGVTKEILTSYERNITLEPFYKPQYIPELENFLRILKSVHSSTDLVMMYNGVQRFFGNIKEIEEIIQHKDDWNALKQLERLVNGRNAIKNMISSNTGAIDKLRELLFLEIALEMYARQLVEKIIHVKLELAGYVEEIRLILQNIIISYPHYKELLLSYDDWIGVTAKVQKGESGGLSRDGLLKLKAVCGRLSRLLAQIVDSCNNQLDPRAKYLGKECNIEAYYTELFTEEMIRGTIFFALSMLLKKVEPIIRRLAHLGDWLIISRGVSSEAINGRLIQVKALIDVQYEKYKEKTVIITSKINGNEEIPENCIGVIMNGIDDSYPDLLAHVSVRARNLNVLFAVCFEEKTINEIISLIDKLVSLKITSQNVECFALSPEHVLNDITKESFTNQGKPRVVIEEGLDEYDKCLVELDSYDKKYVGAKSLNSKVIYGKISKCNWLKYPNSFSLPFDLMSYYLSLDINSSIKKQLNHHQSSLQSESLTQGSILKIQELLSKCKSLIKSIVIPDNNTHTSSITNRLIESGLDKSEIANAFNSIKSVWASKFNERVFLSASKAKISLSQVKIAVLIQDIIPPDYAFVIHTKNPSTNNPRELYAEVVNGLGEVLVGAHEGQPFGFVYDKESRKSEVKSYQNKSIRLTNQGLIFRSDSNIEDLEGFSGAGLFDSVCLKEDEVIPMSYAKDELYNNEAFRNDLMEKIAMIGLHTEELYNGIPQDIEGVYSKGQYYIVQTRPQV